MIVPDKVDGVTHYAQKQSFSQQVAKKVHTYCSLNIGKRRLYFLKIINFYLPQ